MRGHQRNASDTKEFHEVTKRDALMHFELELKTLLNTITDDEWRQFKAKEMERFAALFGRFLQEEGPSVEWDKIQKLPTDAVKDYTTLKAPKDNDAVSSNEKNFLENQIKQPLIQRILFRVCRTLL